MNCPKCMGGAFLSDEELVKIIENTQPMKILVKQTFVCRACSERFSKINWDDLDARRKALEQHGMPGYQAVNPGGFQQASSTSPDQAAAGIQFLDSV